MNKYLIKDKGKYFYHPFLRVVNPILRFIQFFTYSPFVFSGKFDDDLNFTGWGFSRGQILEKRSGG